MLRSRFSIANNYTVLHFDEWDILFIGKNAFNEWIVGSLAYDDDENDMLSHFYLIISEKVAIKFLKRELSYRILFGKALKIIQTFSDINGNLVEESKELEYKEINQEYLPSSSGFCPDSDEAKNLLLRMEKKSPIKINDTLSSIKNRRKEYGLDNILSKRNGNYNTIVKSFSPHKEITFNRNYKNVYVQ